MIKNYGEIRDEITGQTRAAQALKKAKSKTGRKLRARQLRNACPHAVVRHQQVPHPRYGDRVPYFASWTESLEGTEHDCVTS